MSGNIFRGLRQGGVRGGKDQFEWSSVKTGLSHLSSLL
jgi:hypothetical protein